MGEIALKSPQVQLCVPAMDLVLEVKHYLGELAQCLLHTYTARKQICGTKLSCLLGVPCQSNSRGTTAGLV